MGSKLVEWSEEITCHNQYNDYAKLNFHESLELELGYNIPTD